MKILYAIQGTGNGHMARAHEMIPSLMRHASVDLLVSGSQCDINLPWKVKYKVKGFGFVFGKTGGIDYYQTLKGFNLASFISEIRSIPVDNYDLVINDFEPVTAYACLLRRVSCIGLSHQAAVMGAWAPRPLNFDLLGKLILKLYAPCQVNYGFHFKSYDNYTYTPVIRRDIRNAVPGNENHYTVYLPSYGDNAIISFLSLFPDEQFEVFSKHSKSAYQAGNVKIEPVNKELFAKSMLNAKGVFTNAGFETPAETLYLNKKLCVIPMHGQYEQQCNAFALKEMGIPVLTSLNKRLAPEFAQWLNNSTTISVNYLNETDTIIDYIMTKHTPDYIKYPPMYAPA